MWRRPGFSQMHLRQSATDRATRCTVLANGELVFPRQTAKDSFPVNRDYAVPICRRTSSGSMPLARAFSSNRGSRMSSGKEISATDPRPNKVQPPSVLIIARSCWPTPMPNAPASQALPISTEPRTLSSAQTDHNRSQLSTSFRTTSEEKRFRLRGRRRRLLRAEEGWSVRIPLRTSRRSSKNRAFLAGLWRRVDKPPNSRGVKARDFRNSPCKSGSLPAFAWADWPCQIIAGQRAIRAIGGKQQAKELLAHFIGLAEIASPRDSLQAVQVVQSKTLWPGDAIDAALLQLQLFVGVVCPIRLLKLDSANNLRGILNCGYASLACDY